MKNNMKYFGFGIIFTLICFVVTLFRFIYKLLKTDVASIHFIPTFKRAIKDTTDAAMGFGYQGYRRPRYGAPVYYQSYSGKRHGRTWRKADTDDWNDWKRMHCRVAIEDINAWLSKDTAQSLIDKLIDMDDIFVSVADVLDLESYTGIRKYWEGQYGWRKTDLKDLKPEFKMDHWEISFPPIINIEEDADGEA